MNKLNKIITIVISIIILVFTFLFVFSDKLAYSDNEFRYLEKWPKFTFASLKNGKYIEGLENYFTDHFPYRENFVKARTNFLLLINQKLINGVYIASDVFLIQQFNKPQNSDYIVEILNNFYENNSDLEMQILIAPTSSSINSSLLPNNSINYDEKAAIEYYYEKLKMKKINVYDILYKNKDKYDLFYKMDHHWTTYGAYFAYLEYCNQNNIVPYNLDDFEIEKVSDRFYGTLYSKVFYEEESDVIYAFNLKNSDFTVKYLDKDVNSLYNDEYLNTKDKYSYFLGGNHPIVEIINNNATNDDELLIIKDSYANVFSTLIANNYKKIHIIDPRYYNLKISDYIKEKEIKKILILYNINTIDTDTGITNIR